MIAKKPLRDVSLPVSRLGEPPWRIYEMCRRKMIPFVRMGRRYKFDEDEIERWIEQGGSSLEGK
jgi:excisionase family DNA binding protein